MSTRQTRICICLIIILGLTNVHAQSLFTLNSSYYRSPTIAFHNPAPLAFIGHPHGAIGIHLLHTGLADDNLRNNFLSFVQPIGSQTALGLSAQYFTSNVFQRGDFSLLISRKVYGDILSIGANANLVTYGYNTDNFHLFDFNDPLIEDGTNQQAFSFGLGLFLQPVPGLYFSLATNHINKPDISLDQSGVAKERAYNVGMSYLNLPIIPQFEIRIEGDEFLAQGGFRKSFLNQKLNIFTGYSQFEAEGSSLFAEMELRLGDLGLFYSFQNPLTADFSHISSGSHQIGIFYTKGKTPSVPEIILEKVEHNRHHPLLKFAGKALNKDGLKYIEIKNNNVVIDKIECGNIKSKEILKTILLEEGNNEIEIAAHASNTSQKEKLFMVFEPLVPEIKITSLKNTQTKDNEYQLFASVKDTIGLENIKIVHNNTEIIPVLDLVRQTFVQMSQPILLAEGENVIKIIASNRYKSSIDSTWITYQPYETPPTITIDSPQRPVSPSSSIIVNLQLENYEKIREIVIKVNGIEIDTIVVNPKLTSKPKNRGFDIEVSSFERNKAINLKAPQNLVEAIAFDESRMPRTSNTMDIIYNPYADEMKYDNKLAIVVGIDEYRDATITDLDLAVSDADTVEKLLNDLYDFDRIYKLSNEDANFENLRAMLSDTLRRAGSNDLVVFYFAGHGGQVTNIEGKEEGYLIPCDGAFDSVSKNISMDFIRRNSLLSPAKDILYIVDVCYSGLGIVEKPPLNFEAQETEIDFEHLKTQVNKRARNIIAAGGKKDQAIDGLFTRILKIGLRGAADYNHDMYITSTELGLYLRKNVADEAKNKYNHQQKPQLGSMKIDRGEIVLEIKPAQYQPITKK